MRLRLLESGGKTLQHNLLVIDRPATHPDLIGISRFFSTNLGVSRFPDSTCENPEFLFRFKIEKNKRASHFVAWPVSPNPQSLG